MKTISMKLVNSCHLLINRQKIAAILISLTTVAPVTAAEFALNYHKGSDSGVSGYSVNYHDTFTKKGQFFWGVGYSSLNSLPVEWNQDTLTFDINQVDLLLGYRHKLRSYNQMVNKLSIDFQLGGSVMMTENKFTWPELNEEKIFSEKGDVNAMAGIALNYEFSNSSSLVFGVKIQPSASEFDDVSSAYIGFNFRFSQAGY